MSETKFTRRVLLLDAVSGGSIFVTADEKIVADLTPDHLSRHEERQLTEAEAVDYARLFRAAPDLLHALEGLVAMAAHPLCRMPEGSALTAARAALAKARGDQP